MTKALTPQANWWAGRLVVLVQATSFPIFKTPDAEAKE